MKRKLPGTMLIRNSLFLRLFETTTTYLSNNIKTFIRAIEHRFIMIMEQSITLYNHNIILIIIICSLLFLGRNRSNHNKSIFSLIVYYEDIKQIMCICSKSWNSNVHLNTFFPNSCFC